MARTQVDVFDPTPGEPAARTMRLRSPLVPDLAALVSALPDPLLLLDRNRSVAYMNGRAEEFFGISLTHAIGVGIDQITGGERVVADLAAQVQNEGGSREAHDVTLRCGRQTARAVSLAVARVREPEGAVLVVVRDSTHRSLLAEREAHRTATRSFSAMAAMLAHEIKNPLVSIGGAAQLLERMTPAEGQSLAAIIRVEAERIRRLVDQVELLADERPASSESVNIHDVLAEVRRTALAGYAQHVHFVESYDPSLPPVRGARDSLLRLLHNLVKNAAEAAADPSARISLETAYRPGMRARRAPDAAMVDLPIEVTVADSGPGVPPAIAATIFDPFVTTKPGGTGLGLAIVAKSVLELGGLIAHAREGERTVFRLWLPVAAAGDEARLDEGR
jgi:two-component system nitrogen regulation sensor histidine kinase GlnL